LPDRLRQAGRIVHLCQNEHILTHPNGNHSAVLSQTGDPRTINEDPADQEVPQVACQRRRWGCCAGGEDDGIAPTLLAPQRRAGIRQSRPRKPLGCGHNPVALSRSQSGDDLISILKEDPPCLLISPIIPRTPPQPSPMVLWLADPPRITILLAAAGDELTGSRVGIYF
jgi:hypothetical protein